MKYVLLADASICFAVLMLKVIAQFSTWAKQGQYSETLGGLRKAAQCVAKPLERNYHFH